MTVAIFLYLCRRTLQHIRTAIAKDPNEEDYKKLMKVLQYVRYTKDVTLLIEPDNNTQLWEDSSFRHEMSYRHTHDTRK